MGAEVGKEMRRKVAGLGAWRMRAYVSTRWGGYGDRVYLEVGFR